ncbi:hypothetical protein Q3304_09960 [Clostridioides sp. GD02377]|uniref:hypothetical protein n=1 Tax=unclassified Clostridioides TaxID=2635829 RepID=UPI00146D95DC|nr:hypothetical protein [Clostridioides difficile]
MDLDNTFYKAFSSTDSLAFILFPESKPILLGSLTSISYSIQRNKKPVASIGSTHVSGYTRGPKMISGKMDFTLINQNLISDLTNKVSILSNKKKISSDELPLFDVMIVSLNEYKYATQMMIYGIDITNDSQIISIEDVFIKNIIHFVAMDLKDFADLETHKTVSNNISNSNIYSNSVFYYDFTIEGYEYSKKSNLKGVKYDKFKL